MFLHLKRSHRRTWTLRRRYGLSAYVECAAADRRILARHGYLNERVFTEPAAAEFARRAEDAYQRQRKLSVWNQAHQAEIIWQGLKCLALGIRSRTAFHITVRQLLSGTVVECRDLIELVVTEAAVIRAFDTLQSVIDHARAFDTGREAIFTTDVEDAEALTPPSAWPRFGKR